MQTAMTQENIIHAFPTTKEASAYEKGQFLLARAAGKFRGVTADELEDVWTSVEPWITKACVRQGNKISVDEVKKELLARNQQLWKATDDEGEIQCICLTEILCYPQKKYCRILLGTGKNRQEWQGHIRIIEEWAKSQGCVGMEILARNYNSNLPLNGLLNYKNLISGTGGGTSTTSTPTQGNSTFASLGAGLQTLGAIPSAVSGADTIWKALPAATATAAKAA